MGTKSKNYYKIYKENPEWKQKHREQMKKKTICDICFSEVNSYSMKRHEKSQKHMKEVVLKKTKNIQFNDDDKDRIREIKDSIKKLLENKPELEEIINECLDGMNLSPVEFLLFLQKNI